MTAAPVHRILLTFVCSLALTSVALAQGIELKASATVYFGTASTCTQPATIDFEQVRNATPEWKTIRSENVKRGTARYDLLITDMMARIQRACRKIAEDAGKDCVVGHRDIRNDNGLTVTEISSDVIARLESGDVAP